jgi:regulator of RNase E activity RraA
MVMTDDIYEHIRFANGVAPHLLAAAPELRDRTLAINGVSKTYAMTGWRIGWAAGPRELIRAFDTLLSQAAGNACSVSQTAAAAALDGDQSFVAESVATYRARRDQTAAGINAFPGLSCRLPEGAFYLYVNCARLIGKRRPTAGGSRPTATSSSTCSSAPASSSSPAPPTALPLLPPVDRHRARHPRRRRRPHRRRRRRPSLRPEITIEKHPSAPSVAPELLERLRDLQVALISDQLHRNQGFARLGPYHKPAPLAGTAATVRTRAGDNLAILRALELCRPGDVMVVDADGDCANALVGGTMTFYAASIGMAGMVLNGAIRDIAEIGERSFPVYAAGHTHRGPYKDGPGAINAPSPSAA